MVAQSNAMNNLTTFTAIPTGAPKLEALSNISASFELFCLTSGVEALGEMMDHAAQAICGPRHARGRYRQGHRWGKTKGKISFHSGKVEIDRPRPRSFDAGRDVDQHLVHCSLAEPVLRNCRLPTRYKLLLPAPDDLRELERGVLDKTSRADRLFNADEVFGARISQKPHPNHFFRSISSLEETQPSKWGTSAQFPPSPGERNSRVFSPAWPESTRPAQRAAF
jgi:hypothetical protein